jgi:hypothetical protein
LCTDCRKAYNKDESFNEEAIVLAAVNLMFPGVAKVGKQNYLGGNSCAMEIDGSMVCKEVNSDEKVKTKAAYPDISISLPDRVLLYEIDENAHEYYDASCEVARYDPLLYGQESPKTTLCIRFNPHLADSSCLSFLDKLKILLQMSRNWLNSPLPTEEKVLPTMSVQYLFYPLESKHKVMARRSTDTLRVLSDVNELPVGVEFDQDVDILSIDLILKAANENRSSKMLDKHIEYSSGSATGKAPQCEALNNVGTKKEHRCSLASLKGSTLCSRHKNSTKEIKRWNEI